MAFTVTPRLDGLLLTAAIYNADRQEVADLLSHVEFAHVKSGVDAAAKINACVAALPAGGGVIDARGLTGVQASTSTIVLSKPCLLLLGKVTLQSSVSPIISVSPTSGSVIIRGMGRWGTFVMNTLTTQTGIAITSDGQVNVEDLTVTHAATPVSGAGISLNGKTNGVTANGYSHFIGIDLVNQWVGLQTIAATGWTMERCFVVDNWLIGVHVQNLVVADAGDSSIKNCIFNTSRVGTNFAIYQTSSGGLKVSGNKILGHYSAYALDILGTTVILIFEGNSVENQTGPQMTLGRTSGAATFSQAIINGNHFAAPTNGCILVGSAAISHVNITNNAFGFLSPNTAIALGSVNVASIHGNEFSANVGTSVGISADTGAAVVDIGPNLYVNVATAYNNSSATPSTSFAAAIMTTTQRNAGTINPGTRPIIYNSTTATFQGWTGAAWVNLS